MIARASFRGVSAGYASGEPIKGVETTMGENIDEAKGRAKEAAATSPTTRT